MAVTPQPSVPTFPPLLSGRAVDAGASAFGTASRAAADQAAGAGDLFWSQAVDRLDLAVVLEPEVDERRALQVHFVLMVACGDAVGAIGPPELALQHRWPSVILANGAQVGQARLGLPAAGDAATVPAWMVAGVEMAMLGAPDRPEPGLAPERTTLWDEGCADMDPVSLVESISRHFLAWLNIWHDDGFGPVHEAWLARCEERGGALALDHAGQRHQGRFLGLDEHGNLLLQAGQGTTTLDLAATVERFGSAP
ncbi:MAG: biotin/lipoate--protein ligase family protein [Hyphomicrobiales bacterium]